MRPETPTADRFEQPSAPVRVLAGVLSAAAAIGVAHLAAAVIAPSASPVIAIGSTLVDAAPTPVKEFAVRQFGTYDKPVLLSGIGLALLVVAAAIGFVAWRHRRIALAAIAALGVVGVAAVLIRPGGSVAAVIPSVLAGVVGAAALWLLTALGKRPDRAAEMTEAHRRRARRGFLIGAGATGAAALAAGAGGIALTRSRAGGAGSSELALPAATSRAPAVPAGAQVAGRHTVPHLDRRLLPGRHQPRHSPDRRRRLDADHRRSGRPAALAELRRPARPADDRADDHPHLRLQRGRRPLCRQRPLARRPVRRDHRSGRRPARSRPGLQLLVGLRLHLQHARIRRSATAGTR